MTYDQLEGRDDDRFIAPRTPTEKALAESWCEILNLDSISLYDNFIDKGGHSIFALRCVNRMRELFHVDVPLVMLFSDRANIRELAELIDKLMYQNKASKNNDPLQMPGDPQNA